MWSQLQPPTNLLSYTQYKMLLLLPLLLLRPFNGLFSRTTWVSWYQKGETSLDLNEAREGGVLGWQRHQLDHMQTICTSLPTDNHTNTSSLNFYRPHALPDIQAQKETNTDELIAKVLR